MVVVSMGLVEWWTEEADVCQLLHTSLDSCFIMLLWATGCGVLCNADVGFRVV